MASVNKVILVGNLGRDPEVRYMPNGEAVCNFSIATTDSWKDKSGQKQEKTEWHNIVMYRRLAEIAGEYLKKGRPVYIEGRLQTRKWQTKEGQDHHFQILPLSKGLGQRCFGDFALRLHALKSGRLIHGQTNVDRDGQQGNRDQERNPPAPA